MTQTTELIMTENTVSQTYRATYSPDARWVPGWMQPRDTEKSGSTTTPEPDADNEDNTACAA